MTEQDIRMLILNQEELNDKLEQQGKDYAIIYDDSWQGSYHYFNRYMCEIYDTTQNVKEYEPQGYHSKELKCIDPAHVHEWDHPEIPLETKKLMPNFCKYKRIKRVLV